MTTKRGAANLEKYNEERSGPIIPMLTHELQLCRKRKLEFKTPGLLASYLSDRLKVHRTTLTRNPSYLAMLLQHMANQPGTVARAPDTTEDPALLQAKLAVAKLEASTLREERRRAAALAERKPAAEGYSSNEDHVAFANLAMVVAALLARMPEFLFVDFDKRQLHDLSAKPSQRIIAGPDRMSGFCAWVEQNQALPLLKQIKQLSSR